MRLQCNYTGFASGADITIGDFWGIDRIDPDFYTKEGVSLCCPNSKKGMSLLEMASSDMCMKKYPSEPILSTYTGVYRTGMSSVLRDFFYRRCQSVGMQFDQLTAYMKNFRIGLFGSYNTRVAIQETGQNFRWQYSYSSLISLMSPSIEGSAQESMSEELAFRELMRKKDRDREFVSNIRELRSDVDFLVIDFLEERFLCEEEAGYLRTGLSDVSTCTAERPSDFCHMFERWKASADRFARLINDHFSREQLILVRMRLAPGYGQQGMEEKYANVSMLAEVNQYLEKCEEYFMQISGITQIIAIPEKYLYTWKDHRYGCFPYHLNYNAYGFLGDKLLEVFFSMATMNCRDKTNGGFERRETGKYMQTLLKEDGQIIEGVSGK